MGGFWVVFFWGGFALFLFRVCCFFGGVVLFFVVGVVVGFLGRGFVVFYRTSQIDSAENRIKRLCSQLV